MLESSVLGLRNRITGIAGCCARAASGHAAALPRSVMNSRRFNSNLSRASTRKIPLRETYCTAGFQAALWSLWVNRSRSTGSQRGRHFRFAPESDGRPSRCKSVAQCQEETYAVQQKWPLFDDPVGADE